MRFDIKRAATAQECMNEQRALEGSERKHDPSRLLTVSEGAFAIILTLLVLEFKAPELVKDSGKRCGRSGLQLWLS